MKILLNKPNISEQDIEYVNQAMQEGVLSGDGHFLDRCHDKLSIITNAQDILLTSSCTASLEMSALLLNLQPGDEVIMPSYTFPSTATAVALRGAVPVFIDIREDCLNIDESLIEAAITDKSKAIFVVHYAGVSCDMDAIMNIARRYNLGVIEDAAQAIGATYKGRHLGTIGTMGTLSFHATKNIQCGEGGALLINDESYVERAEIIREKGTNRKQFQRGYSKKYTWVDIGSSYLPSDIQAALLLSQLENLDKITNTRLTLWHRYHNMLSKLENLSLLRRPIVPSFAEHNGHIYYILMKSPEERQIIEEKFRQENIQSFFHFVPLHSSPAGLKYGRTSGTLDTTERLSSCLLRLPIYPTLQLHEQDKIASVLFKHWGIRQYAPTTLKTDTSLTLTTES